MSVLNVQCYASGEVRCSVVMSVVISICLIELSVHLYNFPFPHCRPDSPCFVILYQFIQLFTRSHFSHMFSLYSHGILGVVFTHPVGYIRPPSAVNDPTVAQQVNSGKSCLEEVFQLLVYLVALINQYWVRLHGDFRMNKESTMFLASSTKTKNSFVSIVGFVELLLLFLSIAAR